MIKQTEDAELAEVTSSLMRSCRMRKVGCRYLNKKRTSLGDCLN